MVIVDRDTTLTIPFSLQLFGKIFNDHELTKQSSEFAYSLLQTG